MPEYTYQRRIAFHETDAAGVVYYGNYFRLAEEAETHALASLGNPCTMAAFAYPRVHTEADFHAPLHFFEEVRVQARITRMGNTSLHWEFQVYGPPGICATIRSVTTRRMAGNGTPAPYTEDEKALLSTLQ